jgi:hypothetical protein
MGTHINRGLYWVAGYFEPKGVGKMLPSGKEGEFFSDGSGLSWPSTGGKKMKNDAASRQKSPRPWISVF